MKIMIAAFALLLAVPFSAFAEGEDAWDARVASVTGDVVVRPSDGSPEVSAEVDMPLEEGDQVVVGEDGSAEVALDGGSLITVRAGSEFKLEKTAKGDSSFFLQVGSLLAKIQKLGTQRLRVRTPTAVAAVRGTEFGVEVDGDDTHVGVFDEGKVEVSAGDGPPEVLIANQETSVVKGGRPAHAVQLQRFVARRALMRAHGKRINAIRAKWRSLPPEKRRELRHKAHERMRAHRLKKLEKMKEFKQKREDKERKRDENQQRRFQENRRKMEDRRRNIRRQKN